MWWPPWGSCRQVFFWVCPAGPWILYITHWGGMVALHKMSVSPRILISYWSVMWKKPASVMTYCSFKKTGSIKWLYFQNPTTLSPLREKVCVFLIHLINDKIAVFVLYKIIPTFNLEIVEIWSFIEKVWHKLSSGAKPDRMSIKNVNIQTLNVSLNKTEEWRYWLKMLLSLPLSQVYSDHGGQWENGNKARLHLLQCQQVCIRTG